MFNSKTDYRQIFRGSLPALITPFTQSGEVDYESFTKLVKWHMDMGSDGLVPVGTTGESPTLTHDEHIAVVKQCVETVRTHAQKTGKKPIPVIAGAGSNSTREAVDLAIRAEAVGADAILSVAPYYNKPSSKGQIMHFTQVAQSIKIPVILYNIPGRSVIDILPETMLAIHKTCANVVGVKDATNNLPRALEQRQLLGERFVLLSGEDASVAGFMAMGGVGCISVVANVVPKLSAELFKAWENGQLQQFSKIRDQLFPLAKALFCENSPAPTKYALSLLGYSTPYVRLPLAEVSETGKKLVQQAMQHAGLNADWSNVKGGR